MTLGLWLTWIGAVAAAPPVEVVARARPAPAVQVKPLIPGVSLPECRGVVWERFNPQTSRYEAIAEDACGPLRPAFELGEAGARFEATGTFSPGDVVRAVVVVGLGCTPGVAMPLAGCTEIVSIESPTVTVRGAGDDAE